MSKKTIKVRVTTAYDFVKGGDCEDCNLFDYCNDIDDKDCEGGTAGHYEFGGEENVEQVND